MIVALAVGGIATVLSVIVGVAAAFLGGIWDEVLSLVTNVFLVVPALSGHREERRPRAPVGRA